MKEIWKPIILTKGYYSASSLGRIRRDKPGRRTRIGNILKYTLSKEGYLYTQLYFDGIKKAGTVHRIIATAFLGESTLEINHKDCNKKNNKINNLEFVTGKQNSDLAIKNKLHARGEKAGRAKLTKRNVLTIRKKYNSGKYTYKRLSVEFSVHETTILDIVKRKSWKHI